MTGQQRFLNHQSNQIMNLLDRIQETSKNAAATDEQGNWGLDGWIRVFHDLFDMQLRTLAIATEATIEGPWWLLGPDRGSFGCDQLVALTRRGYKRRITISAPLGRLGTEETIDFEDLEIVPPVLAANEVEFEITAKDPAKKASNFSGEIRFIEAEPKPGQEPRVQKQPVIVGL